MDVKATQEEEEEEDLFVFNDTIEGPNLEPRKVGPRKVGPRKVRQSHGH